MNDPKRFAADLAAVLKKLAREGVRITTADLQRPRPRDRRIRKRTKN
ncbi:hypothetical protein [Limnoglobus roseus]|nr:hypothetical protein [Limnoglobus roseus]